MRPSSSRFTNICEVDGSLRLALQRLRKPAEAFGEHFVVHAHADAEVIGHLEKFAGNDGRLEFRSQELQQFRDIAMQQFRETSCAVGAADSGDVRRVGVEKCLEVGAIRFDDSAARAREFYRDSAMR